MENELEINQYHIQNNSDIESSFFSAARKHYSEGNYREALKILLDNINLNADSETYLDIGNCYYMLNDYKEALEYWNRSIELNPKNSKAFSNIGNLHYKGGNIEQAISFWLVALISRPEDSQTCLNLAIAFNQKMMRFESIKYFEKYIKYSDDKSSAEYMKIKAKVQHCFDVANKYLMLGAQLQAEEQDKKAASCYFKSLANYPNLSKTNMNLGSIFFTNKNLDLAVKYWTIASHIDPNYGKIYANLAISYDLMKKFDYAYCYYYRYMNFIMGDKDEYYKTNQRLLKIKPYLNKHPETIKKHLDLANEHLSHSRFYEAIDEYKNYSILNPEETQKYKDIIKKMESYLSPEISIIESCFEIGNQLVNEGRFAEAKPYFFRVMKLSSPQYLEFSKARAKYSHCERAETELNVE